jgi:CRISPR-associated protein Cst2
MSFATGLLLIDAPASALNNLGKIESERYENASGVKHIRTKEGGGVIPYVSAQAFRYWLRATLEEKVNEWESAPIYREEKVAYTAANPIAYWDDDLFGYMRAPGDGDAAKKKRLADPEYAKLLPLDKDAKGKELTVTRAAPFRVSTLVAISPVYLVEDFESMSRHEGDPVPFSSQFYRATLKGLLSLDLNAVGTFSYVNRTGFRNLDKVRVELAKHNQLQHLEEKKLYRISLNERVNRVAALFEGLAQLEGGAKLTLHYTDVMPAFAIVAVTKGGNHIFNHVVGASDRGVPRIKIDALAEALTVFKEELLSDVYVGWTRGYLDEQRAAFEQAINAEDGPLHFAQGKIRIAHPREAFQALAAAMRETKNAAWLD